MLDIAAVDVNPLPKPSRGPKVERRRDRRLYLVLCHEIVMQYRLQKLEAQRAAKTRLDRSGVLFELPDDHIGEKHVVIGSRMATDRPGYEWCTFAEVPGPGIDESEGATVVARISYDERNL